MSSEGELILFIFGASGSEHCAKAVLGFPANTLRLRNKIADADTTNLLMFV